MSRLIDADAYAAELWKLRENYQMLDDTHTADKIMHGIFRAEQALKEQPTVDAVPVVRCRDCRFHIKEDDFEYWCNGFCQPARLVNPDDYCSRGMLKECTIETCGYCENGLCYRAEDAPKSRNCPFTKGEANEQ